MKMIFVLALALSGLLIGVTRADDPKSYGITISEAKVGSVDLPSGEYRLLVHRDQMSAQLQSVKTGEVLDVTGTVQSTDAKFHHTEVHSREQDGVKQITEICIGGTAFRITFQKSS